MEGEMDQETWAIIGKVAAVAVSLFFGGFAVGSSSWVWARKHILGWEGLSLAFIGLLLIGSPTWKLIEAKLEFEKVQFNLKAQQAQIDSLKNQVAAATAASQTPGTSKEQLAALQTKIEQQAAQIDSLKKQVVAAAAVSQALAASYVNSPNFQTSSSSNPDQQKANTKLEEWLAAAKESGGLTYEKTYFPENNPWLPLKKDIERGTKGP
jgi:hypothetical protein